MKRLEAALMVVLFGVTSLAAVTAQKHSKLAPTQTKRPYQVGRASWYGKSFHGRTTANGEIYNMFQFTAAHRQLPLGTWVKVTNLRSGDSVVVRVNDRGPYSGNRIIDLSYGAAQMLGLRARGVEAVRVDLVEPQTLAELGLSELQ